MRNKDIQSSLVWLAFSVFVGIESWRLGLSSLHNPGPGLYPLGVAVLLGFFSIFVLGSALRQKEDEPASEKGPKKSPKGLLTVICALLLYGLFFERLGFAFSTFLLIVVILKIVEKKRLYIAVSYGIAVTVMMHVVFNLWLESNLPIGPFGL